MNVEGTVAPTSLHSSRRMAYLSHGPYFKTTVQNIAALHCINMNESLKLHKNYIYVFKEKQEMSIKIPENLK